MFDCFGLVLMISRRCNMRCDYCYVGEKSEETMSPEIAHACVDRAVRSLNPGGTLELGFFGGEPLLESPLLLEVIDHARHTLSPIDGRLVVNVTTNGTVRSPEAWEVLAVPEIRIAVSHDGLPEVHDRRRRACGGEGTSDTVLDTLRRLLDEGCDVDVVSVVRPENVASLTEGLRFLADRGAAHFSPTLDLWNDWDKDDARRLRGEIARLAEFWRESLPRISVSWFDEKAGLLAGLPTAPTARCGFGNGEIAVAPSGNLYPCERLIGEDRDDNPMRLPGHALDGGRFEPVSAPPRSESACGGCGIADRCNTTCRCSNFIRTGDVRTPDGLLCMFNQACLDETARVLQETPVSSEIGPIIQGE